MIKTIIVEDEKLARDLVRDYLSKHDDFEIVGEYEDGFSGLKAINEMKPDLVFLDIQMPKLDGLETTRIIRSSKKSAKTKNIPIIALTAYAMAGDKEKCMELGAFAYLQKPVDINELSEILKQAHTKINEGRDKEETE